MTIQAVATIGHNSASVGEMIAENPSAIFTDKELVDTLFDEVRAEITAHTPNVETDSGRKAIASLAYGIAKRKTALDAAGKELNEEHRASINRVDAIRRQVRDGLDALKEEARKPLTEWEEAEESRKAKIDDAWSVLARAGNVFVEVQPAIDLRVHIHALAFDEATFGEMGAKLEDARDQALKSLDSTVDRLRQEADDRAELEKLRAERDKAERLAKEKFVQEAAAKAEAERLATAEQAAAARAAREERQKAQDAINAAEAEAKALRDEAEKAAKEQERIAREEAARQADRDHRSQVMKAAKEALVEHGSVSEDQAKSIVLAIAAGSIPNVALRF